MTLLVLAGYFALVLSVGALAQRLFQRTGEDYFLATRSIGSFVLLMSLFGTHMTAFALLGSSGQAYHTGIGVFGLMASASGLVIPLVFFLVGTRAWAAGKRNGYVTQVQLFRDRWGSDALGLLLFVVLVALLVPYLLIGVMGGGITLTQVTDGMVPEWVGGLVVATIVMIYVTAGGLRSTAWVNTFQTLVFMVLGAVTFGVVISRMGGLGSILARLAETRPDLLMREPLLDREYWLTYTLIPLSAAMFPHLFMHWLSARSLRTFRLTVVAYPVCIAIVWLPAVLLGIAGTLDFPGLVGGQSNSILVQMIGLHAPGVLAGLLGAGVFAAVMSSLDSQVLALGSMFTEDIVRHYGYHEAMDDRRRILAGRAFVAALLVLTYLLSLVSARSIFDLATWSFTGFAALLPLPVAAFFWRRSTATGAVATVVTVAVGWGYFFWQAQGNPGYTVGGSGVMVVAVLLAASSVAMVVGSLLSEPPSADRIRRFFPRHGTEPS